jgi:hypothetical protein
MMVENMAEQMPRWLPLRAYAFSYYSDAGEISDPYNVLKHLQAQYGGDYSESLSILEIRSGSILCYIKALAKQETLCLLVIIGSSNSDKKNSTSYILDKFDTWIKGLRELIPKNPDYSVALTLTYESSVDDLEASLQRFSKESGLGIRSTSKIGTYLLATIEGDGYQPASNLELLAIFHGGYDEALTRSAWELCFKISSLADIWGTISHLHSERQPMLSQIDASESSTQIWINEVLARMRKPIEEIQPSDLEDSLKEITIQFSRLSTLTNSMRRDNVKAKALIRGAKRLLGIWNEKPLGELPLISSVELDELEDMVAPFSDFIERTEALTMQFNTVLDSVRTYLGIQQQKLSLSEQSSSRKQLIQLVSLQETLHKFEVLVVAFYLTEMARIVFEVVLSEYANILTVLFIPVALLSSLLLSRMLGKKTSQTHLVNGK